ncbi:unnamed protein product, partial [Staurois parvus]
TLSQGPEPKPGDLIEFYRTGYRHWGVYVGDGYVIHLTGEDTYRAGCSIASPALEGTAVVKKECLKNVARGCKYRVNNKYDSKFSPYPAGKIVRAALKEEGKTMAYSLESQL